MKIIEEESTVSDIIGDIQKGENFIVLNKRGKYIGILPNERLIKAVFKPNMKIKSLYIKIKPIEKLNYEEIAKRMLEENIRVYPIKVNENIELIDIFEVLGKLAEKDREIFEEKVENVMNKNPVTINEKDSITKALALMKTKGVSRLIVVDEKGDITGILSISDIIRNLIIQKNKASLGEISEEDIEIEVRSFSSKNVYFVTKEDNLLKCIEIMKDKKVFALPVIEGSKPIGIITAKDILAYYIAKREEKEYPIIIHGIKIDEIDKDYIEDRFKDLIRKYEKIIGNDPKLILHIKKIREVKEEKMTFFSIKAKLISDNVKLYASRDGEEFYSSINGIFAIFKEELEKRKYENIKKYYIERLFKEGLEYI